MQRCLQMNKAGVSLIAVLLFMLVATIAATATWKWITSEGRSSSSRMLQREAYQSSQAGIENARAWMTFHGNDVGALVKQFLDDPAHKPINIDDRLRSIQRAGQNYHVWLTGVNTENSTYKLKILSSGEARNNARHTEVAIFNVDGLYRVKVASKVNVSSSAYEYAYYGGSIYFQGGSTVSSMVVNGNWEHNPPQIAEGDFVVTGNAILSGNSIDVKKTACIGGTLSATNGFKSKDLYVAGEAVDFNPVIEGDAYFDGPMTMGTACGSSNFQVHGNATINATMNFNACDDRYIAGNTCVLENGQIKTDGSKLLLKGSAWMKAPYSLWRDDDDNYSAYSKLVVGTTSSDEVYIKNAYPYSSYVSHRTNKTFTEGVTTGDQPNKICNAGTGGVQTCKTWGTCTFGMGMFARSYKCCKEYEENGSCSDWVKWEGKSYSPYSEVTSQENLYYLFKLDDGIDDVNFGSRHNEFWNADVSNYFVGGDVFYDLWNVWTEFNYVNGAPTASPYCRKDRAHSNGSKTESAHRPICGVRPWFEIDGTLKTWTDEKPITCAEGVKEHCFEIWESTPGTGCDNSNFKVKDLLKTGYTEFVKKANAAPCVQTILNLDDNAKNNYNVAGLNSCYSTASIHDKSNANDPYLYNGYLVVEMSDTKLFKNPSGELKGKYIFIVNTSTGEAIKAPPTATTKDYVMLYLPEGYGEINMQHAAGQYNYFIYTKGDITKVMGQTSSPLRGSIYATASNCSKVDNIWSSNLIFNKKLMSDMTTNGVLCDASVVKCGIETVTTSSSSSSDEPADLVGGYDTYHISMAPQLGVRLESQNKSSEGLPPVRYNAEKPDLDSSFIVLPRVLSLPNDPYGTLLDYINVIPLNGSHLDKTKLSLSSEGCKEIDDASMNLGITSLSQKLYNPSGSKLEEGYYKCIIKATNYTQTMPVWVIVGESQRAVPVVSFVEESQSIGTTDSKVVSVKVRPHDQKFNLNVDCPANDETPTWTITKELTEKGTGDPCVFEIDANPSEEETIPLFTVTTANASSGTKQFQLLAGEGYIIGNAYADVHISSVALLNRENASQGEIESYCASAASGVCPTNINEWPDCDIDEAWVEPSGAGFITNVKNKSWTITVGGTGSLTLSPVSTKCVVIIPSQSIDLADFEAGETKTLKASAKVKKSTLKVKFVGDVGSGNNPVVNIEPEDRTGFTCTYNSSGSAKECSIDLFGEKVSLSIDKSLGDNSEFSYWKCSGNSCPTTDGISSEEFGAPFAVTDNQTVVYVHFGESDKHCFFDEFRNSAPACASLLDNEVRKYCIDICGDGNEHCESAGATGSDYSNAKWHLVKGTISKVELKNGMLSVKKDGDVTVMSTVNAGTFGTLKALVQLAHMSGSNAVNARNVSIRNTGFLLRSNENATEYLMLSVYADQFDRATAQVCVDDGSDCLSGELTRNSNYLYASKGNMVMVTAKITASDELIVSAYKGNYYGAPLVYTRTFDLKKLSNAYHSSDHGYVGYRLVNREFKLYGIGWISDEFASECHETPPIVKCSFAAVAKDGVIPVGENVKPWIGHSGWFDSHKFGCEEKYYYNGSDASCSVSLAGTYGSCEGGYTFSQAGQHGYTDTEGNEVNTAKAGLRCSLDGADGMWAADPEDADNGAQNRAHCGMFWTGAFTPCTENKVLYNGEKTIVGGSEETISITTNNNNGINLRSTSLRIEVENVDDNEIEIWLYSMHPDRYDEMLPSRSVTMTGEKGAFDVATEFANGTSGFDPEKVVQVAFINKGTTSVKVTRIEAVCANATGVDGCSVRREGNQWTISATIFNRTNVTHYKVTGKRKGPGQENAEPFEVTSGGWKPADEVTTEGNVVSFTYTSTDGTAGPAAGDYDFTVYATPDNGTTEHSQRCSGGKIKETRCNVLKPKPSPGQTSVEIATGQSNPQFEVDIHECANCEYVVKFGETSIATGTCPDEGICKVKKTYSTKQSVGTYTYTISSADETPRFTDCSATFSVVSGSGNTTEDPLNLSNCYDITGQDPTQYVSLYPAVTGCNANCSYTVSPATQDAEGSNSSVAVVQFKYANGSGAVKHTLTISKGTESKSCDFNVTYLGSNSNNGGDNTGNNGGDNTGNNGGDNTGNNGGDNTGNDGGDNTGNNGGNGNGNENGGDPSEATPVTLAYNHETTFAANTTYSLTCEQQYGGARSLVCKTTDGSTHSFTYGDNSVTAYNVYGNTTATCFTTATKLQTTKTISCKNTN